MTALFDKKRKDDKKDKVKETKVVEAVETSKDDTQEVAGGAGLPGQGSSAFKGNAGAQTHRVLKGFYVSEKSSLGNMNDQYMFKVSQTTNKTEIKKEVSKLFNVKVKSVKILNMPEKRRDFGRHPGAKSGFKKAVVILEKGFSIGQAKP